MLTSRVYMMSPAVNGYILRRLVAMVPVLFFVSIVTFGVTLLLPGDPALAYIGETNINDRLMYQAVRAGARTRRADAGAVSQVARPRRAGRFRAVDPHPRASGRRLAGAPAGDRSSCRCWRWPSRS